jgi:hypothetical protein
MVVGDHYSTGEYESDWIKSDSQWCIGLDWESRDVHPVVVQHVSFIRFVLVHGCLDCGLFNIPRLSVL